MVVKTLTSFGPETLYDRLAKRADDGTDHDDKLWADRDRYHPLAGAEEALDLLPSGQLRVLPGTGFLIAYDDPVGVARASIEVLERLKADGGVTAAGA